jgi:hypothetical protein
MRRMNVLLAVIGVCVSLVVAGVVPVSAQTSRVPRIFSVVEDFAGTTLVISGMRFGEGPEVWMDGQSVPVLPGATDARLEVEVPVAWRGQPGTYRLAVRTVQGRTDTFEVMVGGAAPPAATGASQAARPAGSRIVAGVVAMPAADALGRSGASARGEPRSGIAPSTVIEDSGSPYATAVGYQALMSNTASGRYNTAAGYAALSANTDGSFNTAAGYTALYANTTGYYNTGAGTYALFSNTTGAGNTAAGYSSLYLNETGSENTAAGYFALYVNKGSNNTAAGGYVLASNTTGAANTAAGYRALVLNETGSNNTAAGYFALANSTGSGNVALGYRAGAAQTTGSNNVYVGNEGVAAESGTIRIGTKGAQTKTFVAGAYQTKLLLANKALVLKIDKFGQLGTAVSSRRYKTDIRDMGRASEGLLRLRPVTFRYKDTDDPSRDYGLIAEEVAEVYPDLVARNADGQVETVLYDQLPTLLLNEVQKQQRTIKAQADQLNAQTQRLAEQAAELTALRASHYEQLKTLVGQLAAQAQHQAAQDRRLTQLEALSAASRKGGIR